MRFLSVGYETWILMRTKQTALTAVLAVATFLFGGLAVVPVIAQKTMPKAPDPDKVALGENEAKQLLLLMDTDRSGRVSKAEFMAFMEREFDSLDKENHNKRDSKESLESQLRSSKQPFGH